MTTRETNTIKSSWIPRRERIWVFSAIIISILFVLWEIWSLIHLPAATLHNRRFEQTFKNYGSNARLALFFVLANYVLMYIIKLRIWDQMANVKKAIVFLLRFVRRWHTPIAIIAIALIILHAAAVFMYGFKLDFNNLSGLLALVVLLPVPVSGLFRYRRLDRKWHLRSGLAFAGLFVIHAFL
ncbi:hypothetical protein GCM10008018_10170 [Paenibacillus marchantiophytorum]|uniref:Ferric oxidoreductase domain-containing protein n=1 Tax=Paenibacillus marchantiophytorum TaxID=1619310 RepID=A0ABQ2BT22_9BACL|nr:hypothetical protein [Paenibacillus marchantiophytorum]GGI45053.1 hypothetical protein GCM10008018_10170 [Paenibacillus marchantiophytorum]